jgi:hypothetical protein
LEAQLASQSSLLDSHESCLIGPLFSRKGKPFRSFQMRHLSFSTLIFLASLSGASAHSPTVTAEQRTSPFDGEVKVCNDPAVLGDITSRFDSREAIDWKTNLKVVNISHVKQVGFRSNGRDLIPRRFCSARATLSNGRSYALTYNISEDGGFSGWHGNFLWGAVRFATPGSYHLEWCISGFDRHHTYSPSCVMARP